MVDVTPAIHAPDGLNSQGIHVYDMTNTVQNGHLVGKTYPRGGLITFAPELATDFSGTSFATHVTKAHRPKQQMALETFTDGHGWGTGVTPSSSQSKTKKTHMKTGDSKGEKTGAQNGKEQLGEGDAALLSEVLSLRKPRRLYWGESHASATLPKCE